MSDKEDKKQPVVLEQLTREQLYDLVLEIFEEEIEKRVRLQESKRRVKQLQQKYNASMEKKRRLKEQRKSNK